jgi:NTP pyrophosphatase (non-canonical NTP hydrolase)
MDLQMYQKHAKRTMNQELDNKTQLAVLMLGIVGEFAELMALTDDDYPPTQEQIQDEGGDVLWYIANLCSKLGIPLAEVAPDESFGQEPGLLQKESQICIGMLADEIKKHVGQKHTLDLDVVLAHLTQIVDILGDIFTFYGVRFEEACEYNHLKLMKRYKEGFSAEASVNRA